MVTWLREEIENVFVTGWTDSVAKGAISLLKVRLVIVDTKGQKRRLRLEHGKTVIGRSKDCDLAIHDSSLSRKHCIIDYEGDRVLVGDLNSRNGTRINGKRVPHPKLGEVFHNDLLRIGSLNFRFSIRDTLTQKPHLSKANREQDSIVETKLDELMKELDQINTSVDTEWKSFCKTKIAEADLGGGDKVERPEDDSTGENANDSTSERIDSTAEKTFVSPTSTDDSETVEIEPTGKLPKHLKLKPENSQAAAADALKNLFRKN